MSQHRSNIIKYQIAYQQIPFFLLRQTTGSHRGSQQHSGEAGAAPYGRP